MSAKSTWLALVLVGCYERAITEPEQIALEAAVSGWTDVLGEPDAYECGLDLVSVLHASNGEGFDLACEASHETHYACLRYRAVGLRRSAPRVILRPGLEPRQIAEGVIHETMHLLVECELDRDVWDPFDHHHTDPRVWARKGGAESAQWHARRVLSTMGTP